MNATVDLLMSHRSIRKFKDQPVTKEQLHRFVLAGQAAATSSHIQASTVIRVTDKTKRQQMAELAGGQAYVETAPEFLVFCADVRRSARCCDMHGTDAVSGMTEHLVIAAVDVALMAQNVVVAAESEGLGICYIGGIRNNPDQMVELLKLPEGVFPLFGLCLGYPDQAPETKPRLPLEVVLKEDRYTDIDEQHLQNYDDQVREYYRTRTGGNKDSSWSEQMAQAMSKEARPHLADSLRRQGFLKK